MKHGTIRSCYYRFYPNVTMLRSGICRCNSVCCLSSLCMFVHPQSVDVFGNVSMPSCTLAIGWPPCKIYGDRSRATPPLGVKCKRGSRIYRRWTCWKLYLRNGARYGLGYNYWLIGNHTHRVQWYDPGPSRVTPDKSSDFRAPNLGKLFISVKLMELGR